MKLFKNKQNQFKIFYRDLRIFYKNGKKQNETPMQKFCRENAIQNFHKDIAHSYVHICYNARSKQDALLSSKLNYKLFMYRLAKGLHL